MTIHHFSPEQFAQVGDIKLCYQTLGNPNDAPLLLVMGLGVQMIGWPNEFCQTLAEHGFFVIRFDNRDVGRSTNFDGKPVPTRPQLLGNALFGRNFPHTYTLNDMAADAVGLLDHLNILAAHVVGASMGGMISQIITINYPDRVLSLTSIMSTTGERELPNATLKATAMLLRPRAQDLETHLAGSLEVYRFLTGTRYPFEEDRLRAAATLAWERGESESGTARQLGAIVNTPGRRTALKTVTLPSLVIHGDDDPLVRYQHGVDTAEALPNARFLTIPGMSHSLPRALWGTMIDAIVLLSERTDKPAVASTPVPA